jgi:hypothetical protein
MSNQVYAALIAAADAANERVTRCHEVVTCPKCSAPVGVKCRAMPAGYVVGPRGGGSGRELRNPHRERWTLVQPAR